MYDHTEVGSRGYLTEEFRLFHLRDQKQLQLDYHYHPFDKIVIPLSGQVTYLVEGCTYYLRPWDILLVGRGEIHRRQSTCPNPTNAWYSGCGPAWKMAVKSCWTVSSVSGRAGPACSGRSRRPVRAICPCCMT